MEDSNEQREQDLQSKSPANEARAKVYSSNEKYEQQKQRKLVLPGEFLGEGRAGHGTYYENGKVFSRFVGLAEQKEGMHFVIQLTGVYNPKKGDGVIGRIDEIIFSKWLVDINSPYTAALTLTDAIEEFVDLTKTDLTKYFNYSDLIFAEISAVTKTKQINLSMKSRKCRKLRGGQLIKVTPSKVPRIIGKSGSMVEMIKTLTGTQIVVGQNGIVWVKGDNEDVATEAILTIEEKSQVHGLTDFIKSMIEKAMENKKNEGTQLAETSTDESEDTIEGE